MTDSDADLKTDPDDTPPPQGRTRGSMDETEEQLSQLQNPASPSPRPPPSDPPPPVPPSKPTNKEINTASTDILSNLENLDKKHTSNRRSLRRRRASLPSINILPSFKSLKNAMGFFGVDEDNEMEENKDANQNSEEKPKEKSKKKNVKRENDKVHENEKDTTEKNKVNDKNKTLNKKLNPKEIKQLYIKNLKLQAQIDKYREREKEFEYKLSEQLELVTELRNQVNAKSEVVKKLDEQLNKKSIRNENITKELQKLERLLVEKDTMIQGLRQDMLKIEKNSNNLSPEKYNEKSGNLSPSPDPKEQHGNNSHSRSLTPGGYQLDSVPWDMTDSDIKTDTNPSAPPVDDEFLDDKIHGLSLDQKLKQRPNWKDLNDRGILLDDPTTKKSQSLQAAHRTLHKRKASQKLDKFLSTRPDMKRLHDSNILRNVEINDNEEQKKPQGIKLDNGLDLNQKLSQRPGWKEIQQRGILLDDPTTKKSHSLQAAHRKLHKRKASQKLDKLLVNRPTPNDLHEQNIIGADIAAQFFGASPTTQVVTPRTDYMDADKYSQMMDATEKLFAASQPVNSSSEYKSNPNDDIIYKNNMSKPDISKRLERNLRQRPSIDETMSRGILMYRTDTKLNYDLQERHKQLHKRKASQSIEKLMLNRPASNALQQKGILIENESSKKKHKRKASADLDEKLKKRMSISDLQGLGLLFSDKGYEFDNIMEEENNNIFMEEDQQHKNIASLFKQKPRTSKPLHETDFKGIDDFSEENKDNSMNKRRDSIDNTFEPFKLTKKQRISRIGSKLSQRPSVEDMRMRGLLFEHPSISKSLVERKRDLMKRRASNKVDALLNNRPNRNELENKNILLREDETLEKRKRHKRKRSQNLENAIQRRPKLMEEQEAQRQRRRSMDDSDFTPDYLSHILADDEEQEYQQDLQQIEIRFLNIGGFVIPLVSPKFMGDLAGGPPMNNNMNAIEQPPMDDFSHMNNAMNTMNNEIEMEKLREELIDLKEQIIQKDAQIKQKNTKIQSLKGDNSNLKQNISRKSLMDINHLNILKIDEKNNDKEKEKEISKLRSEIETNKNYISKLNYYMKEEKGIEIPSHSELKKMNAAIKNKLDKHFQIRPSFMDLQEKHILSSNFINDVTNQNAQIADRKLKFRRTSDLISNFLEQRPSRESLEQYFNDSLEYNEYIAERERERGGDSSDNGAVEIVDTATKDELRAEVKRLENKLAIKISRNNKLEKENETMRFQLREKLNEKTEILSRNLKAHSINEDNEIEKFIKEADEENRKIKELKNERDELKQKIRRLSTVDSSISPIKNNNQNSSNNNEMKQFINWCKQLQFPSHEINENISNIFNNSSNHLNDFLLMKNVMNNLRDIINNLNTQINKCKHTLEQQEIEHIRDKEKLIQNAMKELDRLRNEIKKVGKSQQIKYKQQKQKQQQHNNNYSYLSSATQYFWNKK